MDGDDPSSNPDDSDSDSGRPVGQGDYIVDQGDCMSSIAFAHGFFWKTLWNHPDNAQLKQIRQNPNILLKGDKLVIPPIEPKQEPRPTDNRHKFLLKGSPAKLRLRLLDTRQAPRANLPYIINIDGALHQGTTDADGRIEYPIPPKAVQATLIIKNKDTSKDERYNLGLGYTDPITEPSGVQQRLKNLGYDCRPGDSLTSDRVKSALTTFQEKSGLPSTGNADDPTRQKLKDAHGS